MRHHLGRLRSRSKLRSILTAGSKLHLGCGPNHMVGWVNIDIDRTVRPDLRLDLRYGLPAPPGSVAFIYSEHVLEHISLDEGIRLLDDCRRALSPGGIVRIAMPNLAVLVERYLTDWRSQSWLEDPAYDAIDSGARMLNLAFHEWGHRYLYDPEEIELRLKQVGFVAVEGRDWGESPHPELRGVETRPESNLIVEASAP